MSPSVTTRMASQEAAASTAQTSESLFVPSFSTPSSASTSKVDLPDVLDECVKETFILGFSSAVIHSAVRDLSTIREAVLGVGRIKDLVIQGCSPDQIACMIASKQELLDGFRSVEGDVRDLALGYTVVQIAAQYQAVAVFEDPSIDSIRLRRFRCMAQDMKAADAPKRAVDFPAIDYTELLAFIEQERANGSLVDDPEWEEVKKKYKSWKQRLQKSLETLNANFQQAAEEVDWTSSSQMDTVLLEALPASSIIQYTLDNHYSAAIKLSSGPSPTGRRSESVEDAESLSRLGKDFRSDVLDFCKHMANDEFKRGRFDEAERLYHLALKAGSNDASVTINRAAALLKMERFEEAQKCCTVGLLQLDIARLGSRGESQRAESAIQLSPCQRSRPMQASQERLDELRWKTFIRRGRAHKGMLVQLDGLSGSSTATDPDPFEADFSKLQVASPNEQDEDAAEEDRRAEERGRLLLAARSDFAAALQLDPLDDIARQEMTTLTIDPLQRRSLGLDPGEKFALSSISQLARERKRKSQEVAAVAAPPAKPQRRESSPL
ncbi:hypothetical protein CBS101457_005493 [Exobasidium rhododendri]|nr:hypothetical protein CBS101457_005493 [Exobasidium rhododendri]